MSARMEKRGVWLFQRWENQRWKIHPEHCHVFFHGGRNLWENIIDEIRMAVWKFYLHVTQRRVRHGWWGTCAEWGNGMSVNILIINHSRIFPMFSPRKWNDETFWKIWELRWDQWDLWMSVSSLLGRVPLLYEFKRGADQRACEPVLSCWLHYSRGVGSQINSWVIFESWIMAKNGSFFPKSISDAWVLV